MCEYEAFLLLLPYNKELEGSEMNLLILEKACLIGTNKATLQNACDITEEEDLDRMIDQVKTADANSMHSKAFDSIRRDKILKILRIYGIPEELILAIAKTYEKIRALTEKLN
ncbi:Hypothetical predicted protein [Octopus vulgaris]|uniref:Uncharacterized protein n=1 Tax=Octopus vulgaris TaxID=6645 RepID=A0AA36AFU5_OCTVU|nr:Hypothetical predicted protein [Octopus vulgaris]